MKVSTESLRQTYLALSTDKLEDLLKSGDLTLEAKKVLTQVLLDRGNITQEEANEVVTQTLLEPVKSIPLFFSNVVALFTFVSVSYWCFIGGNVLSNNIFKLTFYDLLVSEGVDYAVQITWVIVIGITVAMWLAMAIISAISLPKK